jgi:subfamily B ATP-binding cassette protein MsbA
MSSPPPIKAGPLIARLWRDHLHRYLGAILALTPVLMAIALLTMAYGLIMKDVGDKLTAQDLSVVTTAPLMLIGATLARAIFIWAQAVMSQGIGHAMLRDLQNAMFTRMTRADFARFSREQSGQMVSRLISDINVIAEGLIRAAQAVARDALTLIGALATMFWYDWVLALLVIGLFALAGPALSAISKRARRQTEDAQLLMGRITQQLSESLSSPRFVKTYGLEQHEETRASEAFEARRKMQMKLVHNRARVDPLMEILGGLALAAVIALAGARIVTGDMSVGDLLGTITAIAAAAPAARSLGTFNTVFNEGIAALARVYRLIDERDTVIDAPDAKPLEVKAGGVRFEAVSFSYGGANALDGFDLTIAAGERVALVGASGAGKSTVFNLIPRLYDPTAGRVLIDEQDIRTATLSSVRRAVALVSQDVTLFDDTIRANIAFGRPDASNDEIEAAARAAAAHDFIMALPDGYATRVGERGANLSGGERQRISIARAFLRDAPILLLDEATSALDAKSEALVQDSLARLTKGRTSLIIAHRLSTIRDAHRIIVLDQGRIVEDGDHASLLAKNGYYARLAKLQLNESAA